VNTHAILRERILIKAGITPKPNPALLYEKLAKSEWSVQFEQLMRNRLGPYAWSSKFEQLMRNRLIMGAFRYGLLGYHKKPQYDRIASALRRLEKYAEFGNLELLVDVANMCLVEFVEGKHPDRHWDVASAFKNDLFCIKNSTGIGTPCIREALDCYTSTKDLEALVLAADWSMVEFVEENHTNSHWEAADDGEHATAIVNA